MTVCWSEAEEAVGTTTLGVLFEVGEMSDMGVGCEKSNVGASEGIAVGSKVGAAVVQLAMTNAKQTRIRMDLVDMDTSNRINDRHI
jgi:hypothetical protein